MTSTNIGCSLEIPFADIKQGRLQTRQARWSSRRLLLPIVPPWPILSAVDCRPSALLKDRDRRKGFLHFGSLKNSMGTSRLSPGRKLNAPPALLSSTHHP